ncbi:hypothetical protein MTBSS4_280037 [Magnetospirillum sp. SS-4]|nr:hypothetical protein MTBSS4_280037 [Magnetospirillum sp. SS-4]
MRQQLLQRVLRRPCPNHRPLARLAIHPKPQRLRQLAVARVDQFNVAPCQPACLANPHARAHQQAHVQLQKLPVSLHTWMFRLVAALPCCPHQQPVLLHVKCAAPVRLRPFRPHKRKLLQAALLQPVLQNLPQYALFHHQRFRRGHCRRCCNHLVRTVAPRPIVQPPFVVLVEIRRRYAVNRSLAEKWEQVPPQRALNQHQSALAQASFQRVSRRLSDKVLRKLLKRLIFQGVIVPLLIAQFLVQLLRCPLRLRQVRRLRAAPNQRPFSAQPKPRLPYAVSVISPRVQYNPSATQFNFTLSNVHSCTFKSAC